jgi:spermidine synthase
MWMQAGMSLRTAQLHYQTIETALSPLGEVMLRRYETDEGESGYEIRLNGNFLMATHGNHSEKAMARLAYEMLGPRDGEIFTLVGGLGAGYTLGAALDLPRTRSVTVSEISEKVVEWNRKYFSATNGNVLADPRVEVVVADLADHLAQNPDRYDLALLDVDNGPGWLAAVGNERLYTTEGVELCRNALRPGGILAVWSPSPNPIFHERFRSVFPGATAADTTTIGREVGEPGDVIYLGRKES